MTGSSVGPWVLVATAATTALFHTLIPDHWVPFVLIGMTRRWSAWKAATWSGISALMHIIFSILLGLTGIAVGIGATLVVGQAFDRVSGLLLVAFGVGYALYARRKRGHWHIGGELVHRAEERRRARTGSKEDPEQEDLILAEDEGRGPLFLAAIIGLNPCVLVFPLLMKGVQYGLATVIATSLSFGAATMLMMVGLTFFGVSTGHRLELHFFHRYGEMFSGWGIAVVGVVFLVIGR